MPRKKKYDYEYVKALKLYRKRDVDINGGKPVYAKTPEELAEKLERLRRKAASERHGKENPTVREYIEKWSKLHRQYIRESTAISYRSLIKVNILPAIGNMRMRDVTSDDIKAALLLTKGKSSSIYDQTDSILRMVFAAAAESHIIEKNPCPKYQKGGIPAKIEDALKNEEVDQLLTVIHGTRAETFVILCVYTGMRREEICGLQWDCVFLDCPHPYVAVRRAVSWPHNQPAVSEKLKTQAARRDIPLPSQAANYLRERRETAKGDFVVCDEAGNALTWSKYRTMWGDVLHRTTARQSYIERMPNGTRKSVSIRPKLGEKFPGTDIDVTLDFYVHPHRLRRTYITRLIMNGVDPKTVQYLAGHKNSQVTMDIYARVMYNRPEQTSALVEAAFS